MRLLLATNNAHKVREIRDILSGCFSRLDTLADAGLDIEVAEDGATFEANAVKKAEEVLRASDYDAALADDTGLVVDALGGAPGVHSARYAGEQHSMADNIQKLLADMADVPEGRRACRFSCAIALARRGRPTICVTRSCEGVLLGEARGGNGFGYDPYFYYEPLQKTFAELSSDEKNGVSHRKRALMALLDALEAERRA